MVETHGMKLRDPEGYDAIAFTVLDLVFLVPPLMVVLLLIFR